MKDGKCYSTPPARTVDSPEGRRMEERVNAGIDKALREQFGMRSKESADAQATIDSAYQDAMDRKSRAWLDDVQRLSEAAESSYRRNLGPVVEDGQATIDASYERYMQRKIDASKEGDK